MKKLILLRLILICSFIVLVLPAKAQLNFEELNVPNLGLNINAIAMTTENIGVTVGDYGTILSTSDGFTTWTLVPTGTKKEFLAVAFFDASTGVAVGADGIIYRTTTAGVSWQLQPSGVQDTLRSIAILGNRAIVVGSKGAILESTDKGISWNSKVSGYSGNLNAIKFHGINKGVIVGENGLILQTKNGGQSWNKVFSDSTVFSYIASVDWANDTTVIAVGSYNFTARSTDAGETWQKYYTTLPPIAGGHFKRIYFLSSSVGFIGGTLRTASYPSTSVLWTIDGGKTWKTQDTITSYTVAQRTTLPVFFDFLAVSPTKIFAVGSDFLEDKTPIIAISDDGGIHWKFNLYQRNNGRIYNYINERRYVLSTGYDDIKFIDNNIGLVAGFGGEILKTIDGGDTWKTLQTGTERRIRKLTIYDNSIYGALGDSGMVLLSNDAGQTWNEMYPLGDSSNKFIIGFRTLTFSDSKTMWFSTYNQNLPASETGLVLRTNDFGKTWTTIKIAGADNDLYYSMVFKSPLQGWMYGYRNMALKTRFPVLLHTSDGGTTWEEQSLPPLKAGEYLSSLNTILVFSDTLHGSIAIEAPSSDSNNVQTYFHTIDGGKTWFRQEPYNHASPAYSMNKGSLTDLDFSDEQHGVILATFSFIGLTFIHYTDNAGDTWKVANYSGDTRGFHREFYKLSYPTPKRCWILGQPFRIFRLTLPEVSGVNEQSAESDGIRLFPNPTSTSFTLSGVEGIASVRIVNSLGEEVKRSAHVGSEYSIDVSDLVSGLYFVSIRTAKSAVVKPMLVRR
ncbi:MAG: T9SS type A sorting domain-containing protein [Bacteroidetes bacterium]|nr:T9SS type A sorting domain-containing protein [Bacteroidota bacterium]